MSYYDRVSIQEYVDKVFPTIDLTEGQIKFYEKFGYVVIKVTDDQERALAATISPNKSNTPIRAEKLGGIQRGMFFRLGKYLVSAKYNNLIITNYKKHGNTYTLNAVTDSVVDNIRYLYNLCMLNQHALGNQAICSAFDRAENGRRLAYAIQMREFIAENFNDVEYSDLKELRRFVADSLELANKIRIADKGHSPLSKAKSLNTIKRTGVGLMANHKLTGCPVKMILDNDYVELRVSNFGRTKYADFYRILKSMSKAKRIKTDAYFMEGSTRIECKELYVIGVLVVMIPKVSLKKIRVVTINYLNSLT